MTADVDELARDLTHAEAGVRLAAATALADHVDASLALAPLVACLRDADGAVREAAATALRQLGRRKRERVGAAPVGISPGQVALKGAQSLGCLIQLIFGLIALVALVLKIVLALN